MMSINEEKLSNIFISEEKLMIEDIACLRFIPKTEQDKLPTLLYYHGWSSNKNYQRFKAGCLAAYGYQVIVPDSIYHGERDMIDHNKDGMLEKYLFETILTSIQEAPIIIEKINNLKETDGSRVGIMGTSMGGFISSGIFVQHDIFKSLVVFNGACAWHKLESFDQKEHNLKYHNYKKELIKYDPAGHLNLLADRPILLLHGDQDSSIPIEAQRYFYKKAEAYYQNENKIMLQEYPGMDHYISTGMLEKAVLFNEKYLK